MKHFNCEETRDILRTSVTCIPIDFDENLDELLDQDIFINAADWVVFTNEKLMRPSIFDKNRAH